MSWYKSAVFYHIYPIGLCGVPRQNSENAKGSHFGELTDWLTHIKEIGCNAIYIGPLFESVAHGYETTDYKMVDKRLGTNDDFKAYVAKCHDMGIKVVVDGVFNHTGREFFAFKDLKANREASPYKDWYCNVNFWNNNEYNDGFSYEGWRGYNELVKLNGRNPAVKDFIFDVVRFWVTEFDIDGIRLDCADVLDFDFMRDLRGVAASVKPDFWLMGEVIHGDYSRWVNEQMLNSVTNYDLHKGLYSGHNDHNYFEIAHTVRRLFGDQYSICKGALLYNFVDNHDVDRLASKVNNKAHLKLIYALNYTLPGIPSIYYGSEFGLEGRKENGQDYPLRPHLVLSDFRTADEGSIEEKYSNCNKELLDTIAKLGGLKAKYEELTSGAYRELTLTNRQYSYARILDNRAIVVMLNNDDNEAWINAPMPVNAGKALDVFTDEEIIADNGRLNVRLDANSFKIFYV